MNIMPREVVDFVSTVIDTQAVFPRQMDLFPLRFQTQS
jgi:hypothetical protein